MVISWKLTLWRITLLAFGILAAWGIVVTGMSTHYGTMAEKGDTQAAERALTWDDRNPKALTAVAASLLENDPAKAKELLERSIQQNPADARPFLGLADLARQDGDLEKADQLVRHSTRLMPVHPGVLKAAGGYWASRDDLPIAISHWSTALETDRDEREALFPIFVQIAENAEAREHLAGLTESPPEWWTPFFIRFSRDASTLGAVRAIFDMRKASTTSPPELDERWAFIWRLQQDGLTAEAYLNWLSSLSDDQRTGLGLLYNGDFEEEITNQGFDWHIVSSDAFRIDGARRVGSEEGQSLYISFRGRREPFRHVFQPLFLSPGFYRLRGRARTERLDSVGGLRWVLSCAADPDRRIRFGESETFLGSGKWSDFAVDFAFPSDCDDQRLSLVSVGQHPFEHAIKGAIWFDALKIEPRAAPGEESDEKQAAFLP